MSRSERTPIGLAFDGILIAAHEFKRLGYNSNALMTEDVINVVIHIAKSNGYRLEDPERAAGNNSFYISGADLFKWSADQIDEDYDGPGILIERVSLNEEKSV